MSLFSDCVAIGEHAYGSVTRRDMCLESDNASTGYFVVTIGENVLL